ncbi:Acyl-acyl carrier protein thioesterase ATL3, chloroplastic [Sesamum angolense]|uniref:Acyl-acyl carrier protein thioesterase ATL3, chloroplastic n=1 Tax=Sesamum angolense TaxID=2727404 RepID=A0AAE1XD66_9LAMI|nr:Acyl-acyl carrier protein thioesterase ATL3, chloroplastic [Sesamum angolense]
MPLSLACLSNINLLTTPSLRNINLSNPDRPKSLIVANRRFQPKLAQLSANIHPLRQEPIADRYVYQIELSVRDYELDQFGVVNNAVYPHYCQHGFNEFLKACTSSSFDMIARSGNSIAVSGFSFKFVAPLKSGDRFLVKIKILGWSKTRLFIEQSIVKLPNEEPIMEGRATTVWLDKKYRPMRIPPLTISEVIKCCSGDESSS